jgi:hypothetical protein
MSPNSASETNSAAGSPQNARSASIRAPIRCPAELDSTRMLPSHRVEVDQRGGGHLIQHRRPGGEPVPDAGGRPGQRDGEPSGVLEHRVHHVKEGRPPGLPQRAYCSGGVTEPGPADRVQARHLPAERGPQLVALRAARPGGQFRPRAARALRHHQVPARCAGGLHRYHREHRDITTLAGQPVIQRLRPQDPLLVAEQRRIGAGRDLDHQSRPIGQVHQMDGVERPARRRRQPATRSQLTPAPARAAVNRAVPGSAIFSPSASSETATGGQSAAS